MKNLIIIFGLIVCSQPLVSQTVSSSCSASNSLTALYIDDADRLALRKIYAQNLTYKDSIIIPQTHADTVLKALIAVHNATTLPARDTVVSLLNIHTFPNPILNTLYVVASPTLSWMQQLNQGNIPTGNTQIDGLISTYSLIIQNYSAMFANQHVVTFKSNNNYNLQPLTDLFENISGVDYSEPDGVVGDGNDIAATIYADHVKLMYFLKWGDCPAGCTALRYWVFNVYYDCSVEYVGSYGTPLPNVPIPVISVSGLNCTNETLTVTISNANYASVNYQPISGSQFTLSSSTPTLYSIMVGNYPFIINKSISIIDCATSVNENEWYPNFSMYPNPTNEILNVALEMMNGKGMEIYVYDVLGTEVIKHSAFKIYNSINVSTLPKGIYFIKVGERTKKFVKE